MIGNLIKFCKHDKITSTDTEKNMKKQSKPNSKEIIDIIRWCVLVPATCFMAWLGTGLGLVADTKLNINTFFVDWLLIFILSGVFSLFTVRLIAPKYKKQISLYTLIIIAFWAFCVIYGLWHMAY